MSFIELNPWRRIINVGVEIVKPRFRIDGGPEGALLGWRPSRIAVDPGPHRVEMWFQWAAFQHAGQSAVDVQVPPSGVRLSWRAPSAAFAKGQFTIEAPGNDPFDVIALPTGAPMAQATGAAANPPAWHPDPSGRHQYRWWDGTRWTGSVSDNGVVSEDPA